MRGWEVHEFWNCGASTECLENAFKECKPAKMSQSQGGPVSEMVIVGLEGKKCVLKITGSTEMTGGAESMTCKFENYALGMKDVGHGSIEQYCTGKLTYWLASAPKMIKPGEARALNSVVNAIKLSADPNDLRYSFTAHDPEGVKEFSIIKSDFGEVLVNAEPPCSKEFTSELKFKPSDLPLIASVIDCGTPIMRHELKVDIKIPAAEEERSKEVEVPAKTETLNAISACEKIREPGLKYKCTAMVKKDSSDCEMVDEPATAYCYADVALVAKDSAICGKIKEVGHREACKALVERAKDKCSKWIYADYCYRDVAALIGDTSVCDKINYEGGKMNCKAVILNDASLCQNSGNEDCYQMLALLKGDKKVCDELSKIQITGERPIAIANLDKEVSKCIKMAEKEITGCLFESGSGTDCDLIPAMAKNPSLCENLQSDYPGFAERDRCYFYAAIRIADLLPPQLIVLRN
ncbi:hypothetical protein HYU06_01175 [Candidatus Woesearchaeota archaeon]|nr:hypothetical protein [Candidatus Woesearchaeota archaeon]